MTTLLPNNFYDIVALLRCPKPVAPSVEIWICQVLAGYDPLPSRPDQISSVPQKMNFLRLMSTWDAVNRRM